MLNKFKELLSKITRAGVVDEKLVKEIVKDVQRILIASDVNVTLVKKVSEQIDKKAIGEKLPSGISRKEHVIKLIYDELAQVLGGETHAPRVDKHKILLVGLFGSGKTTCTAKLARFYSKRGLKTCILTTDVWRPAAFMQAKQLGEQVRVPVFGVEGEKNPMKILKQSFEQTKAFDLVIVDSAGRDSLNNELIREIVEVKQYVKPEEIYLVISADIGQTASTQAKMFDDALGLTGVIVTKADASGKAGGALSACAVAGVPVVFVSTGEKPDDFEIFDSKKFVARLLGFPDIDGLLTKVKEAVEETEFNPEDILKQEYTLDTFYKQLEATKKMGPLKKVFEMLGAGAIPEQMVQTSEDKMKKYKYILDSMTGEERKNPDVISGNRIKRVAKGSGTNESDVKELLRQFAASKKMIQKFKKGKIRGLKDLMRKVQGGGIAG